MGALLALIPVAWRWGALLALALAVAGFAAYQLDRAYVKGRDAALEQVEKANEQAERGAAGGQAEVDACYAHGGAWDRARGLCVAAGR
jgi:hypothetical protein